MKPFTNRLGVGGDRMSACTTCGGTKKCPRCDGTTKFWSLGHATYTPCTCKGGRCWACGGTGAVRGRPPGHDTECKGKRRCSTCDGKAQRGSLLGKVKCKACRESGEVPRVQRKPVRCSGTPERGGVTRQWVEQWCVSHLWRPVTAPRTRKRKRWCELYGDLYDMQR